jgi:hypothetical protein
MKTPTIRPLTEDEIAHAATVTAADRARAQRQLEDDSPLLAALVEAEPIEERDKG